MYRWTRLIVPAAALACSLAPAAYADLLGSITFYPFTGGNNAEGPPPVLAAIFATISPQGVYPFCYSYVPAPDQPCFSLVQKNLTAADAGKSFVIDANTNADFSTITSLLSKPFALDADVYTYPAGIVPALPLAAEPSSGSGFLVGAGTGAESPGIPNADITQLQYTLTSLCMSNNGSCDHGSVQDLSFSARLDIYGESVPEPATGLYAATAIAFLAAASRLRKLVETLVRQQ